MVNIHVSIHLTQVIAFLLVGVLANVDQQGFISIDCGSSTSSNYHGLNYTSDENYITTGTNNNVSSSFINTSDDDDEGLYNTVRSFSGGTRNCYTLSPLKPNNKYLIRARFMYGNYNGQESAPKFDVYIGVNFWDSIEFKELDKRLVKEIIHYSVSDSIDVCLVDTSHRHPFISALELRPLDEFAYDVASDFCLKLWNRWDVGRRTNSSNENDDAYNRLWYMHNWSNCSKVIQTNQEFVPASDDPYKVPSGVLSTACEQSDNSNAIANLTYSYRTGIYNGEIYVYWHFAELDLPRSNDIREFYIYVPLGKGYTFGPIRPKHLEVTTVKSGLIPLNGSDTFVFSLNKTDGSNLNPILNAVEMYKKLPLDASPTNQEDVDAINEIKKKYNVLKFWQGDPCLPQKTQWDGLICDQQNPPRITSLNLNSRNLSGELPPSLFKLESLESLSLANNGFTGKIPDFLVQMPSLIDIDLTGNNLTGPIPPQLLEKACNNSISLRLEGVSDACKMLLNKKRHRFIIPLVSSIASITILVIIGVILFIYKRRQKQGIIYRTLKSRNKQFSYSDIVKMTDNFRKIIGKGAFGTVYYGLLQDGTQVAVKILNNTSSSIIVKQFCAEAELLTKIHHVNLVTLIGYCEERLNMALVYEYMSSGNLKMHLSARNKHPLNWKTRLQISIDAAQGLEYLHSGCQPTIIHRDIKPENILLDEVGHAKISDFGLSRFFTTEIDAIATTDIAGTLGYLDPEYCRLSTISDKSDVYGFGVVLLELITGKPPIIKQANQRDHRVHIIKWATEMVERGDIWGIVDKRLQGEFSENTVWKLLEVAMACVNLISSQRPKMSEVVADLKMCYADEGFKEQKSQEGVSNENGCIYMSQPLDRSPMALLPDTR